MERYPPKFCRREYLSDLAIWRRPHRPVNLSHLVLKSGERVIAAVQARLTGLPNLRLGLAYIRWGPLWKRRDKKVEEEVFRQTIRAIRNKYRFAEV